MRETETIGIPRFTPRGEKTNIYREPTLKAEAYPGFPDGIPTQNWECQPIIWPKCAENWIKMKKIGPGGRTPKIILL